MAAIAPIPPATAAAPTPAPAPAAPAAPPAQAPKTDSVTLSPQALALHAGDVDHDGDSH